jgi:hypothetical protein
MLENGVTLCVWCHAFNSEFSAHRTPEAFNRWFKDHFRERAKLVEQKANISMPERLAIKEFVEKYETNCREI